MNRLTLLLVLLVAAPAYSQERASVVATGSCRSMILAGKSTNCLANPKITYAVFQNGRAMLMLGLEDGRVVGFISEKDAQPQAESYYMYLSRVRINSTGSEFIANVGGQCHIAMSRDGKVWSKFDCHATDENGAAYSLEFQSDGEPVSLQRPGVKPLVVAKDHPSPAMIRQVVTRFKTTMSSTGIRGVANDVAVCFDRAGNSIPLIRTCMLYEAAAIALDQNIRQLFQARGTNPGDPPPFFSEHAIKARMQINSTLAFGGSENAVSNYLGSAPTIVIQNLSK